MNAPANTTPLANFIPNHNAKYLSHLSDWLRSKDIITLHLRAGGVLKGRLLTRQSAAHNIVIMCDVCEKNYPFKSISLGPTYAFYSRISRVCVERNGKLAFDIPINPNETPNLPNTIGRPISSIPPENPVITNETKVLNFLSNVQPGDRIIFDVKASKVEAPSTRVDQLKSLTLVRGTQVFSLNLD